MKTLRGILVAGSLMLALPSASHAQLNINLGQGTAPAVTFGQPNYAQPYYGQRTYTQPAYGQTLPYRSQAYVAPNGVTTYSSGYSGYTTPSRVARRPFGRRNTVYSTPYRQGTYYGTGYTQPYRGTGMIVNGRTYTLPR